MKAIDLLALKEVEVTKCLLEAGLGLYYHRFFFHYGVKEAAHIAAKNKIDVKCGRGRPKEVVKGLSVESQLHVVELYYRGHDLLTIHQLLSPESIDSIFFFLRLDDTDFGYHICTCGQPFVYAGLGKHNKCSTCQKDTKLIRRIRNVDFKLAVLPGKRISFENSKKFNDSLMEHIKTQLLNICYCRKLLRDMVQSGAEIMSHIQQNKIQAGKDPNAYMSFLNEGGMNELKKFVSNYYTEKESILPATGNRKPATGSKRVRVNRDQLVIH